MPAVEKQCSKCERVKSIDDFDRMDTQDGRIRYKKLCRDCLDRCAINKAKRERKVSTGEVVRDWRDVRLDIEDVMVQWARVRT